MQLDDTKKISADNNHDTAMDTSELEAEMKVCSHFSVFTVSEYLSSLSKQECHYFPCYLILQQLREDIEEKELLLQKINVRLTEALQKENDERASYKDFIGMKFPYY